MHRIRRLKLTPLTLLLGGLLLSSSAWSSDWRLSAGTLDLASDTGPAGSSLQLQSPLSESLRFRLGLATSRFDNYIDDTEIHRSPSLSGEPIAGALLDYHFSRWGLRFTGGALYSTPTSTGTLLSQDMPEANPESGLYDGAYINGYESSYGRDMVLPYLGLGWGQAFGAEQRVQLKMDFGVAFQGVTDLDGNTGTSSAQGTTGSSLDTHTLDNALGWENQFQSLRYSFSAGVRYRF